MPKRKTHEEFLQESIVIYGDQFQYCSIYKNTDTPMDFICKFHGEFSQIPKIHLRGNGCPKCTGNVKLTTNEFIRISNMIHGCEYDYTKTQYRNRDTDVVITCSKHGDFNMNPRVHMNGGKCTLCTGRKKLTTESFIEKSKQIHGDGVYSYDKVVYGKNNKEKVEIICNKHGSFLQRPNDHLSGKGCKRCSDESVVSKAVSEITNWLTENNIVHVREYIFDNCSNINKLRFDFYIPHLNMCIEYDGIQHFKSFENWGGDEKLKQIQINDKIKNLYCIDNGIQLVRIKYTQNHIKCIEKVIKKYDQDG